MLVYECLQFRRIFTRTTKTTDQQIADQSFSNMAPLRPRQQQLTDCSRRMRERERKKPKREHESNTSLKTFIENRQFLPIPAKYIHTYTNVCMYTKLLPSFHEIYRLIKALCFDLILNLKCVS